MNYTIRSYKHSDFETLASWWLAHGEVAPMDGTMVPDGSFILELDDVPALSISVLLTQSKECAMIEGFIKNPLFNSMSLEAYGHILWDHACSYARERGYKRVFCLTDKNKLFSKYERFGMRMSLPVMTFVKEL